MHSKARNRTLSLCLQTHIFPAHSSSRKSGTRFSLGNWRGASLPALLQLLAPPWPLKTSTRPASARGNFEVPFGTSQADKQVREMGGGGCHGDRSRARGAGGGGRNSGSDWLCGRAAFSWCTCAVTPRRGRGEAEAPRLLGRASQDRAGTCSSWPGHSMLCREGNWRSPRTRCRSVLSPPRRRLCQRRHCCLWP